MSSFRLFNRRTSSELLQFSPVPETLEIIGVTSFLVGRPFSRPAYTVTVLKRLLKPSSITACISDVSSQWEGAMFDPRSSEILGATDLKLKTKKHVLGPPHMPNMVKIGLWVLGLIPSLSPHLGYPFLYTSLAVPMRHLDRSRRLMPHKTHFAPRKCLLGSR